MQNFVQRHGLNNHGLLRRPEEELAAVHRLAAIKPKGELIQVVVQMLVTDCSLVGPHQPPFQQRDPPLKFRTVSFPQYGFKADLSGGAFLPSTLLKLAPGIHNSLRSFAFTLRIVPD